VSRYSTPFFLHFAPEYLIETLPGCVTPENPARYPEPITADGFLRYMVRRIAGSLIEIGRGKLAPDAIWDVARWTAPAKGLTLWSVEY